ncbi:hypothetical protein MMAN_19790 [Mycobacterium mantenii]|uniref:Uncharacterized protein n=1 Tax=Mycobacterium mantenii TaxID=560555 RepID=A0ABM7JS52_MYCNT|nr:hypothetical protein MMAN_19790 [Mycobacterium mantenii]
MSYGRRQYADENRCGDAYEEGREPSELGYVPALVNRLPPSEGGPYRGKAPRAKRIIGRL